VAHGHHREAQLVHALDDAAAGWVHGMYDLENLHGRNQVCLQERSFDGNLKSADAIAHSVRKRKIFMRKPLPVGERD
jgi:hypothetical protein